jgi:AbrB family looped-hinge helix DNA binding protein
MNKAKMTFKGQITIPKEIRHALALKEGDSVIVTVQGDHAVLKPLKKKSLSDFYGTLPATRPYSGLDAIRDEIRQNRAKRLRRKGSK